MPASTGSWLRAGRLFTLFDVLVVGRNFPLPSASGAENRTSLFSLLVCVSFLSCCFCLFSVSRSFLPTKSHVVLFISGATAAATAAGRRSGLFAYFWHFSSLPLYYGSSIRCGINVDSNSAYNGTNNRSVGAIATITAVAATAAEISSSGLIQYSAVVLEAGAPALTVEYPMRVSVTAGLACLCVRVCGVLCPCRPWLWGRFLKACCPISDGAVMQHYIVLHVCVRN